MTKQEIEAEIALLVQEHGYTVEGAKRAVALHRKVVVEEGGPVSKLIHASLVDDHRRRAR